MIYPDPLPFKLRVLRALTAALKEITPTNGYVFDMADFDPGDGVMTSRVYRGRMYFGDEGDGGGDPIPMLSILESTEQPDEVGEPPVDAQLTEYDWGLLLQGFLEDDKDNPTDPAYLLLADVRRRLNAERTRKKPGDRTSRFILGFEETEIISLAFDSGTVRPADDVSAKAWFWLRITLRVTDNAEDPYGQLL